MATTGFRSSCLLVGQARANQTTAQLLERHGSLEGARAGADRERLWIAVALTENAYELRAFRAIDTLHTDEIERPADRPADLGGGAQAARQLGLNRLAERLEAADALSDL